MKSIIEILMPGVGSFAAFTKMHQVVAGVARILGNHKRSKGRKLPRSFVIDERVLGSPWARVSLIEGNPLESDHLVYREASPVP